MEILGKIFGSTARVKTMRIFLLENEYCFQKEEIISKSKVRAKESLKEINFLVKIGFIQRKKIKIKKSEKTKKDSIVTVWQLNPKFKYIEEFKNLLTSTESLGKEDLLKKINKAGKIKLVITAGIFMDNEKSSADLLIVGEGISKRQINNIVKNIESDIGRELRYGVLTTEDYKYRITVYDKFVRDILDFPHNKILDKLNS